MLLEDPPPGKETFDATQVSGTTVWEDNANPFRTTLTAVPEPSSAALLGLSMVGLLIRRRK